MNFFNVTCWYFVCLNRPIERISHLLHLFLNMELFLFPMFLQQRANMRCVCIFDYASFPRISKQVIANFLLLSCVEDYSQCLLRSSVEMNRERPRKCWTRLWLYVVGFCQCNVHSWLSKACAGLEACKFSSTDPWKVRKNVTSNGEHEGVWQLTQIVALISVVEMWIATDLYSIWFVLLPAVMLENCNVWKDWMQQELHCLHGNFLSIFDYVV